jgi:hypothetical protein
VADTKYEWRTALIHLLVAAVATGAAVWVWRVSAFYSSTGLWVGAVTNLLIGREKIRLLRRGGQ